MRYTINHLNGLAFEERVFNFLKEHFDCVEWSSKKFPSCPWDFLCIKDGQIKYGDAKIKKELNISKRDKIDFIVIPSGEELEIIYKEGFGEIPSVRTTTIKVSTEVLTELHKMALIKTESPNNIIKRLIETHNKIYTETNINEENLGKQNENL